MPEKTLRYGLLKNPSRIEVKRFMYNITSLIITVFRLIRCSEDNDMKSSVLFVDKIAGVPVSSTVDNIGENMAHQVQLLLPKSSPPLHLASRLDVCTSGICSIFILLH